MFAGIVCLIGAIQNHIIPLFLRPHSVDLEGHAKHPKKCTLARYLKKYFLIPATFQSAHIRRPFCLSIPLRPQTIFISIYLLLNLTFLCVDADVSAENVDPPDQYKLQLTRYVAGRSGILAVAQLPLLIAFAGRNNVLIWLTGWSFSTFNVGHKWVARVCLIQSFIHSVGFTVYYFQQGGIEQITFIYQIAFLRWGAVVCPPFFRFFVGKCESDDDRPQRHAFSSAFSQSTSSVDIGTRYSWLRTLSSPPSSLSDCGTTLSSVTLKRCNGCTPE
jgi:hypothetical protein